MKLTAQDAERFWSRTKRVESGCLEWQGSKFSQGYGVFYNDKKLLKAHRVAFHLSVSPIPDGLFVCHKCDNPSCVEPSHLFLGNAMDNNHDMMLKGRYKQGHRRNQPKGERHHKAILKEYSVRRIRLIGNALTQKEMAVLFKCSKQTISAVLRKEIWKFVK